MIDVADIALNDTLHSTYAAARIVGVTPQTIRNHIKLGLLKVACKTTSGRALIADAEIERYRAVRASKDAAVAERAAAEAAKTASAERKKRELFDLMRRLHGR